MEHAEKKRLNRISRHTRLRAKISGTTERPRVAVFKSNRNIFVQVIDDVSGKTLASNSIKSSSKNSEKGSRAERAEVIGSKIGEKMKGLGITEAVFDRGGSKFHGRVKAVAEGIRKHGIKI